MMIPPTPNPQPPLMIIFLIPDFFYIFLLFIYYYLFVNIIEH